MIDVESLIFKYYSNNERLRDILWRHSNNVADKCLRIAILHPELGLDTTFLREAALLHDIGIIKTDAPGIFCFGDAPYICHGYLGAEILRNEGLHNHARVCERHTGTGLSMRDVELQNIPIPLKDYRPETMEEQVICFADKFFSKTHPDEEKSVERVLEGLSSFGEEGVKRFKDWIDKFG